MLQTGPIGGGLAALVGVFLAVSLFYAVTLHLAATFFLGEVPSQRAAYVGPVPAAVSILLGRYGMESVGILSQELGVVVVLVTTLLADAMAIAKVYGISRRATAGLTLLHFAFATVLGFALANLLGFA
ncbi:DUF7473 family protein [Halorhabdus amylolytica]|uniref:DUF7473 family protein n=1 Tax=Halorhabdus amylolytica TaxID=2559573 RepID=UPI0010A9FB4D|nr:hypothetical protein [Halorhabdus amylolytica]